MSSDKKIRDCIDKALDLKINLSDLDTDRKWFRVGKRGNLHLDRYCYRLTDFRSSSEINGKISGLKGRICSHCFESNLDSDSRKYFSQIKNIVFISESRENIRKNLKNSIDKASSLRELELLQVSLNKLDVSENSYDSKNILMDKINSDISKIRNSSKDFFDEIIHQVSLKNLENSLELDNKTSDNNIMFGKNAYNFNFEEFFRTWKDSFQDKKDYKLARDNAVSVSEKFNLLRVEQIQFSVDDFNNFIVNDKSNNLQEVIIKFWKTQFNVKVNFIIDSWEKYYKDNLLILNKKIVAIKDPRDTHDNLVSAIFGCYKLSTNQTGNSVILLPENVANFLESELNRFSYGSKNVSVHELTSSDSDESLQTALTLWQPDRYSKNEYSNFEVALETSRKL